MRGGLSNIQALTILFTFDCENRLTENGGSCIRIRNIYVKVIRRYGHIRVLHASVCPSVFESKW
jgi:hypothetical protein